MAVQPVGTGQGLGIGDAAQQIVGGHVQRICQSAEVVEGGLAGSGLEVGDGGGLKAGAFCERLLAQGALLPRGVEPFAEDIGRSG